MGLWIAIIPDSSSTYPQRFAMADFIASFLILGIDHGKRQNRRAVNWGDKVDNILSPLSTGLGRISHAVG